MKAVVKREKVHKSGYIMFRLFHIYFNNERWLTYANIKYKIIKRIQIIV